MTPKKSKIDAKEESKWLQIKVKRHFWGVNLHSNSSKSHFEKTPCVVKMTLLKGLKMTLYRCQPERSQNDSLEGVDLGSRKWLLWRSQNDSFELTVYWFYRPLYYIKHARMNTQLHYCEIICEVQFWPPPPPAPLVRNH
jgi:hypothetical protein